MSPGLKFDEASHSYVLNGVRLPSVTQILKPLYDFTAVDPEILARAGRFGTAVHRAVELWRMDDLDTDNLDPELVAPLGAFQSWYATLSDEQRRTMNVEQRMAHKRLKFAGTADIIIDGHAIIDVKTRKVNALTDPLQLAAYEKLWLANGGAVAKYNHYILELRRDGTYQFVKVNHREAWPMFRMLLDHHKMTVTINQWKERK